MKKITPKNKIRLTSIAIPMLFALPMGASAATMQYLDDPGVYKPASLTQLHGYFNFDEIAYPSGSVTAGTSPHVLTNTAPLAGAGPTTGTITSVGAGGFEFDNRSVFSGDPTIHSALRISPATVSLDLGGDAIYLGLYVAADNGTTIQLYNDGALQTTFSTPSGLDPAYLLRGATGVTGSQSNYYVHFTTDESTRFDEVRFLSGSLEVDNIAFSFDIPTNVLPVPEPSSAILLGCGALSLGILRRRK